MYYCWRIENYKSIDHRSDRCPIQFKVRHLFDTFLSKVKRGDVNITIDANFIKKTWFISKWSNRLIRPFWLSNTVSKQGGWRHEWKQSRVYIWAVLLSGNDNMLSLNIYMNKINTHILLIMHYNKLCNKSCEQFPFYNNITLLSPGNKYGDT